MSVNEKKGDYRLEFCEVCDETIFIQEQIVIRMRTGRWPNSIRVGSTVFQPLCGGISVRGWIAAVEYQSSYPRKNQKWGVKKIVIMVTEGSIGTTATLPLIKMRQCEWLTDKPLEMEKFETYVMDLNV